MTKETVKETREALEIIRKKEGNLSREDEIVVIAQIKAGDNYAFEILEEKFAGYLDTTATNFWKNERKYLSLDALKADCRNALWEAARSFDYDKNCRFETLLRFYLKSELYQHCYFECGISERQGKTDNKIKKCISNYIQKNGETPSCEVIADETGMSVAYIKKWFTLGRDKQDVARLDDDDMCDMADKKTPIDEAATTRHVVKDVLDGLDPETRDIIIRFYIYRETKKDIAKATGHCRDYINKQCDMVSDILKQELGDTY